MVVYRDVFTYIVTGMSSQMFMIRVTVPHKFDDFRFVHLRMSQQSYPVLKFGKIQTDHKVIVDTPARIFCALKKEV